MLGAAAGASWSSASSRSSSRRRRRSDGARRRRSAAPDRRRLAGRDPRPGPLRSACVTAIRAAVADVVLRVLRRRRRRPGRDPGRLPAHVRDVPPSCTSLAWTKGRAVFLAGVLDRVRQLGRVRDRRQLEQRDPVPERGHRARPAPTNVRRLDAGSPLATEDDTTRPRSRADSCSWRPRPSRADAVVDRGGGRRARAGPVARLAPLGRRRARRRVRLVGDLDRRAALGGAACRRRPRRRAPTVSAGSRSLASVPPRRLRDPAASPTHGRRRSATRPPYGSPTTAAAPRRRPARRCSSR